MNRNCRVLIKTRISKANDLLEFKGKHAEITGFSKKDRQAFMFRMLDDQTEVGKLKVLCWRTLDSLLKKYVT